jgi:hypothetical protein
MNALFIGRRQHGKTTLSVSTALEIQAETGRGIIIYDINSQVDSFPDDTVFDLDGLQEKIAEHPSVIVYRPLSDSYNPALKDELENDFAAFTSVIWPKTDYVLIVDEAHWLQGANFCEPSLAGFVRMSDPHGIDLLQSAHALSDMWGRARGLASHLFIFKLTRKADLEAVASLCGDEVAAIVKNLPKYHFVRFHADEGDFKVFDKPDEWFVDVKRKKEVF